MTMLAKSGMRAQIKKVETARLPVQLPERDIERIRELSAEVDKYQAEIASILAAHLTGGGPQAELKARRVDVVVFNEDGTVSCGAYLDPPGICVPTSC
jgi:hypothetical protein